jgi:hypothetical protein
VSLSNRTIAMLADAFFGGAGPSHARIDAIWDLNGATAYLVPEAQGNKQQRVLYSLRRLRDGLARGGWDGDLPPNEATLHRVAGELAATLVDGQYIDVGQLEEALARDGLALHGDQLVEERPRDAPADDAATRTLRIFGDRAELAVAKNHFEQAERAFDNGDWEAANSQYRSAFDATYDALAHAQGCPAERTGGRARRWLQDQGIIEEDEADLMKSFVTFAGRDGSHAGLSDATDSQLRRHFASALIGFGVAKLG